MTPTSHPDLLLLGQYAFGRLPSGPSLVLQAHLRCCAVCRDAVRTSEALGGALLAESAGDLLAPERLAKMLSQIVTPASEANAAKVSAGPTPAPRRWTFPNGVWVERLATSPTETWRTFRIGAPAGATLPEHRHTGEEFTCVLVGEIEDDGICYRAGDFSDGAIDRPHRLRIGEAGPGVALISTERRLQWTGVMSPIGRLLGL